MPTVGNTAKPTSSQEGWGLNSVNQMAQAITMPGGGPWIITALGCWLGGWNSSPTTRLCVWDAAGNLLAQSGSFTVANHGGIQNGGSSLYTAAINLQVNGGQTIYVGFHRHSDHPMQNGRYSSGSHLHDTAGDAPESLAGFSTDGSGGIGAYVANYQSANQAPVQPTLTTQGQQHNGRTLFYSWVHNDQDGNPQADAHWQLWADGAAWLIQEYYMSAIGSPTTQTLWATLPPNYAAQTTYWYRVRTSDGLAWGPWSDFVAVRSNHPPNPAFVNTPPTNTLTPVITSGGTDPDGDGLASVQLEVRRDSDSALMWLSPEAGGAFAGITYAGTALAYGTTYRVRARTIDDEGAWGPWGNWTYWTPVNPAGPDNLTPASTSTKQNTLTPTLTVGHSVQFRNEEIEVYVANSIGSTRLWQKTWEGADYAGTLTKGRVYAGTALSWGGTYYWRARVERTDGVITDWSELVPFYVNAEPTAPTGMDVVGPTGAGQVGNVISPSGERVVTTLTPTLRAIFADADRGPYADAPTAAVIEVRDNATDALIWTGNGTAEDVVYAGPALAYDTTYKWRKRYTDNAGRQGPFSAYQTFKVSQPPTAAGVSPIGGAAVTESTPTLDWTFTSPGGKAQYSFRILVEDKGPVGANYADPTLIYDSGERVSAATSFDLPYGTLVDGHDYTWRVIVKDTDGLTYELA